MKGQRTLMVMAGGTGGHVFPALAVADELAREGWRVVWLGTQRGLEAKLVPPHGFEMVWLPVAGLRGNGLKRWLALPLTMSRALSQCAAAIFRYRPDVVMGMGGYTAFPGGVTAWALRRPLIIHEQNSVAGLTNKVLAKLANRVLVAFPAAFREELGKSSRFALTGNPVRPEITALPAPAQRFAGRSGPLKVLVVGGSLGAQALNEIVPQALALLPEEKRPQVTHQAGAKHVEQLQDNYRRAGVEALTVPFLDDMARAYGDSDLVICRSGALTVAELAAAGVASVLVPYPHAVDDHQTGNARYLSDAGAAVLMPQRELTAEKLAAFLAATDRAQLLAMAEAARRQGQPDALRMLVNNCKELAEAD